MTTVLPEGNYEGDAWFGLWQVNEGHKLVGLVLDVVSLDLNTELVLRLQLKQPNGSGVDVAVSPPVSTPGKYLVEAFVGVFAPRPWRAWVDHLNRGPGSAAHFFVVSALMQC